METDISYQQVLDHFGTPSELARRLDISPQAVYQWGGVIPRTRRFEIAFLMESDRRAGERENVA